MIFASKPELFSKRLIIAFAVILAAMLSPSLAAAHSIEVRGNRQISTGALKGMLGALRWDGSRDEQVLRAVQDAYIRKGYLFARVGLERMPADSTLVLHVSEGDAARVGAVTIRGAAHFDSSSVAQMLSLRSGDYFDSGRLDRGVRELLDGYDRAGFPFAQVWIDSLGLDPVDATVLVGIHIVEGESKQLRAVEFEGLKKTREDLAVRLTGLESGKPYNGARMEEAYLRLTASGIFDNVEYPEIRVSSKGDGVEALIRVVESMQRNTFSFALGYADREEGEDGVFSGVVRLEANNIGGSLRDVEVFWRNDGADRSETRLGFRQRFLFGHPLSAGVTLEQIGLDTLYTWQSIGVEGAAPLGRLGGGLVGLDFGVNGDRNTFSVGSTAKSVRLRLRGGLSFTIGRRDVGSYVDLLGRGTYASKSLDARDGGASASVKQYIVETTAKLAAQPFAHVHVTGELVFKNISSEEDLVPLSEQFYLGGAGTLRGYRENQFHSRRIGYDRNEILIGRSRVEHGYVFLDVGYFLEEEADTNGVVSSRDRFKVGHGFGLRTASPAGRIDISFGLGEQFSLRQTKVHVILDRSF